MMQSYGVIVGASPETRLDKDRWLKLCNSHPKLQYEPPSNRVSPFDPSQLIEKKPRPGNVSIVESNQRLGLLRWARDASPFIIDYGEDAAVVPIALELAELMDAVFTDDVSEFDLD